MQKKLSRRDFLTLATGATAGSVLAACASEPQVIEKVVTKEVEKEVIKTVEVEVEKEVVKEVEVEVEKEVEKVVTATSVPQEAVTVRFIATAPEQYYNMDALSESDPLVDVEFEDIGDQAFGEVLLTSVAGGDPPEIAWAGGGNAIWRWAQMGAIVDITPLMEEAPHPELDQIDPNSIGQYNSPDFFPTGQVMMAPGQYGWPVYATLYHFIFNKRILDQAGVDYPQQGWSWDDFRSTLQQVNDPGNQTWGFVMPSGNDMVNLAHNMLWTNGGSVYDAAGKSALASPESIETFQFLQDLVLQDGSVMLSGATEGADFLGGNLGFQYWGNWIIGWYDFALEDPYGIVPAPVNKEEVIYGGIDGFVFLRGAANPWAGWRVATWLSSYEGQKVLNDENEVEVVSVNKLAAAEAYDNPNFSVPEEARDWMPAAVFTSARFNPWIPVGPGFNYLTAFDGLWLGDPVEDTLTQIASDMDMLNESMATFG